MFKTVWVLTREINQYDQDGEYFVAVFGEKPTEADLLANGVFSAETAKHVLNSGGRINTENEWWYLRPYLL